MHYTIHTEEYKGYTIKIVPDNDPMNPRKEFDHIGKMVCFHRRYNLGDEQPKVSFEDYLVRMAEDYEEIPANEDYKEEVNIALKVINKHFIILPLYLYDHSGITIKTSPFTCKFDSGMVGVIYMSNEDAKKNWPGDNWKESAIKCLEAEVNEYDNYLTGNVSGFVVEDSEGVEIQSVYGFYPDSDYKKQWNYVIDIAKDVIDSYIEETFKIETDTVACLI